MLDAERRNVNNAILAAHSKMRCKKGAWRANWGTASHAPGPQEGGRTRTLQTWARSLKWLRGLDSNQRPGAYETPNLPLIYPAIKWSLSNR